MNGFSGAFQKLMNRVFRPLFSLMNGGYAVPGPVMNSDPRFSTRRASGSGHWTSQTVSAIVLRSGQETLQVIPSFGGERNYLMKRQTTDLIAFFLMVVIYSTPLFLGGVWSQAYIKRHSDKPGISEIRQIAKENNLSHSEVGIALRSPRGMDLRVFVSILVGQSIFLGFTLGLFWLIRRLMARFSKPPYTRIQPSSAGYMS